MKTNTAIIRKHTEATQQSLSRSPLDFRAKRKEPRVRGPHPMVAATSEANSASKPAERVKWFPKRRKKQKGPAGLNVVELAVVA